VFIIAAIAAMEKRAVANIDFPSAFLLAEIPEDAPEILVEFKFETRVLCKIDPSYERFVLKNGKCIVKLKRPLYGTVMAARLWYEKLSGDLLLLGFEKNIQDECVFNRVVNGKQQTLVVHVDDMLITAENEEAIDNIIKQIGEKYNNLSIYRGRKLDYLGMTFDFSENGKVKVTMNGYIQDLLELCNDVEGLAKTPAGNDLFEIDETSELLDDVKKQLFHSIVAKFQYLGKRVRPDLLTAISFLSRRINSARAQDMKKLHRLIRYLRGTSTMGIILQADNYISIYAYVDASYGVHSDLRSQTGCVIGLGCGPVYCKSTAQKINTKSSTEAELVSLSDMTGQIIWTRNFLEGQGYKMPPAKVYQDNMSTIALVRNGKSNNNRTRHIAIRYFFVADKVRAGEISIEYLPTGHMIADILTKPLQGEQFLKLRKQLLNWSE
jgi:histone deacetylase 1/2